MNPPGIDYASLVHRALVSVVAGVLGVAAREGLPGDHHFFVTFRTDHEGVSMPDWLRRDHPRAMTIVLQHQFEALEVDETDPGGFAVTLRFSGRPVRLSVPFSAITSFADPSVGFGLRLGTGAETGNAAEAAADEKPPADAKAEGPDPAGAPAEEGNVVRFRPRTR